MIANKDKTHCKHGHSLIGRNLFVSQDGIRVCRTCRSNRSAKFPKLNPKKPKRAVWANNKWALDILVGMYPDHTSTEISAAIGFSKDSVKKKALELRLKKSEGFLKKYPQTHLREESEDLPKRVFGHLDGELPECHSISDLLIVLQGSMRRPQRRKVERKAA